MPGYFQNVVEYTYFNFIVYTHYKSLKFNFTKVNSASITNPDPFALDMSS